MRIPRWRLALTGTAILVLAVAGIGMAQAAPASAPDRSTAAPEADPSPSASPKARPDRPGLTDRPGRDGIHRHLGRPFGRNLVHAEVTVNHPEDGLVTFHMDHGTVSAIGNGTLTISEAGDTTVTVATDAETRVRKGGENVELGALAVGDEVFVASRVPDGSGQPLAKHIRVPKPKSN